MMDSFRATPEPCASMKIVVVQVINNLQEISNDTQSINVIYSVEFIEIKQEKVKQQKQAGAELCQAQGKLRVVWL